MKLCSETALSLLSSALQQTAAERPCGRPARRRSRVLARLAAARIDVEVLELAIQVRALHANGLGQLADAAAGLRELDAAIAAESTAMLSDEESHRFLAALDAPFTPNERLQHAMQAAAQLQPR